MRPVIAFERPAIDVNVEGRPVSKRVRRKIIERLRCDLPHAGLHTLLVDEPQMRAYCAGCGATWPAHAAHFKVGRGPIGAVVPGLQLRRIV